MPCQPSIVQRAHPAGLPVSGRHRQKEAERRLVQEGCGEKGACAVRSQAVISPELLDWEVCGCQATLLRGVSSERSPRARRAAHEAKGRTAVLSNEDPSYPFAVLPLLPPRCPPTPKGLVTTTRRAMKTEETRKQLTMSPPREPVPGPRPGSPPLSCGRILSPRQRLCSNLNSKGRGILW